MEMINSQKDVIFKHLNTTLNEMGYAKRDVFVIMRRLEKKVQNHVVHKKAKTPLSPLKIMDVDIPQELYNTKIADLNFYNSKIAARVVNALGRSAGVVVLRDFIDKNDNTRNLAEIRNFGAEARKEFLKALKQTIGE
ncbi:MAG: hypothetical protein LBC86_06545 [Oscillospiraceae bacterium]|jgi:hypothetical protein|nr:hypothetical protein [Oscillospiraceae bacterium]